jgi:hypothetical protein
MSTRWLVVYVPIVATPGLAHAAALRSAISQDTVPVLTTFPAAADGRTARGSVPSFRTPERAVARTDARRAVRLVADQPGRVERIDHAVRAGCTAVSGSPACSPAWASPRTKRPWTGWSGTIG